MFDINVDVEEVRGVSIMYAMTVGKDEAKDSSNMLPDADQTNTSIWPGVSTRKCLGGFILLSGSAFDRRSIRPSIWSILVAKRFREVRIPPLGPRLYCFMTSL